MIPYIGDLSIADAELLRELAGRSDHVLEFGAGASTQIFAAYSRGAVIDSVETEPEWIEKTERNIVRLCLAPRGDVAYRVRFHLYQKFLPAGPYDLVFVDGIDELRSPFAFLTWPELAVGGRMAFHDTRRTAPHGDSPTSDVQNVCALIERYSPEIARVVLNENDSNTTVVTKRAPLLVEDWNAREGRTLAQIGLE